jgi:D-threo-aldose 1-dehydrogenase
MRSRALLRSGISLTELGFGGAPLGNLYEPLTDDAADACLDAAWRCGIRYFDTAPHYGLGLSEMRLGRALALRPRHEFVVSTKVGRLLEPNPKPTPGDRQAGHAVAGDLIRRRDYSRSGVRRSLDASLQRLQLDRIDIAYVHDPEEHMQEAFDEAVPALVEMREEGVIGAVGVGMNFVDPLRRFVEKADIDVVLVAGRWTLADRSAATLVQECASRNVSVVAAAPFNSGLLANPWPPDDAYFDYAQVPYAMLQHARRLARVCREHSQLLPHAAIQFPLLSPVVCSVLTGLRSVGEVESAVSWAANSLPVSLWAALDDAAREIPRRAEAH